MLLKLNQKMMEVYGMINITNLWVPKFGVISIKFSFNIFSHSVSFTFLAI
jgi:hypothetical protein